VAAGFEKPVPFPCETQWLDLGNRACIQICVSITLNGFLAQLLLRILSEEIAQQVRQSLRSGDVRQAHLFNLVGLLFSDAPLGLSAPPKPWSRTLILLSGVGSHALIPERL
jgi:hypothetical protein